MTVVVRGGHPRELLTLERLTLAFAGGCLLLKLAFWLGGSWRRGWVEDDDVAKFFWRVVVDEVTGQIWGV